MSRRLLSFTAVALLASVSDNALANTPVAITYVPNSLTEATITGGFGAGGPWTLHQAVGQNSHDASGIVPSIATPYVPPTTAYGMPYANYCRFGKVQKAQGVNPMQPFYFPFVRKNGPFLEGFFDYRPRNEQESTVAAISSDWGKSWTFRGQALGLNPYCPADPTDPDNNNVVVGGVSTPYGSNSANAADNGLGHAFVMGFGRTQYIYHLNRANGHIDSDPLVVHTLMPDDLNSLASLPDWGYVSPLAAMGYPTLEASAQATAGLVNPDAFLGSAQIGRVRTVVYVEKQLDGATGTPVLTAPQTCSKAPTWSLTYLDTGKQRKANNDIVTIRVATTTDGIHFTDVGPATGLLNSTSTSYHDLRWLGSVSIIPLSNGRYGMFFGAGNCLDNDSDGFHVIGYAETMTAVNTPSDLLNWTVINGFDNPILSTDSVTDPVAHMTYPANPPIVNVSMADVLTPMQVSPWVPPVGHNTNFFSGRVYDPQAIYTDSKTVTIVFAGYNTPQPSSNLGDYRTIGRFQVQFPPGYVKRFPTGYDNGF
jgi:hypothetical protein